MILQYSRFKDKLNALAQSRESPSRLVTYNENTSSPSLQRDTSDHRQDCDTCVSICSTGVCTRVSLNSNDQYNAESMYRIVHLICPYILLVI
jgi:ferredoxin